MGRTFRRVAGGLAGLLAIYVLALLVVGWAARGCARERARDRLARSLQAEVTIGDLDLGLVTGAIAVGHLHVRRDARGHFQLDVDRVDVDLLPLGLGLIQDGVGDVRLRGVRVALSALGALELQGGGGAPLRFDSLVIDDAQVRLAVTSLLPGVAEVDVVVEHVAAGPTVLRTPLSWLFALRQLRARIELPMGLTVHLAYDRGTLRLSGKLFGATPIEVPFAIPALDPAHELDQLADLGKRLARQLAGQGLDRWLHGAAQPLLDAAP
ncbi:MAG: hypothetical protein H6709_16485 [Kofleriaceae bacterium]|nr:hypothetical protein [Myxococcales bacterium]MCB9563387.1 hypothetical protein [Kofleriaceae bacterium]MCB9573679.1 hypothetical protein [Kofleriaceae bacterium]